MLALAASCIAVAQHHGQGAGHIGSQPGPFELGGYIESTFTHYRLNRDSAFYRVDFSSQPQRATLDRTGATLRLSGNTRLDQWRLRFQSCSTVEDDQLGHESASRFDELAASWKPHPDLSLDAGKMVLKWGKGHSWNPVAFVERPKDTSDPRLPHEGYTLISVTGSREFSGALKSITFNPLLLPVTENLNHEFGKPGRLNLAAKLQLDYGNTEIGFYFLNSGSRSGRLGVDFSRDITNDLEIYGEWARIKAQNFQLTTPQGTSYTRTEAATRYLTGLRDRTANRRNFILELHHNGTGYSTEEFQNFVTLVDNAARTGADGTIMERAQRLAEGGFERQKIMQNYLYFRASQAAAPFTPSIRLTVNLQDGGYSIAPELLYSARSHWGLRAQFTLLGGGANSEYGAKYYSRRAELRLHYHF